MDASSVNGSQAFFQIATVLIPALLFGGLVAERFRPVRRRHQRGAWRYMFIPIMFVVSFLVLAEMTAIWSSLLDRPSRSAAVIVITGLALGLFLVGFGLVLPWLPGYLATCRTRVGKIAVVALLIFVLGSASFAGAYLPLKTIVEGSIENARLVDSLGGPEASGAALEDLRHDVGLLNDFNVEQIEISSRVRRGELTRREGQTILELEASELPVQMRALADLAKTYAASATFIPKPPKKRAQP